MITGEQRKGESKPKEQVGEDPLAVPEDRNLKKAENLDCSTKISVFHNISLWRSL